MHRLYEIFRLIDLYKKKYPVADVKLIAANTHHNKVNPPKAMISPPKTGAMICAADQAILYKPAYCPRL